MMVKVGVEDKNAYKPIMGYNTVARTELINKVKLINLFCKKIFT